MNRGGGNAKPQMISRTSGGRRGKEVKLVCFNCECPDRLTEEFCSWPFAPDDLSDFGSERELAAWAGALDAVIPVDDVDCKPTALAGVAFDAAILADDFDGEPTALAFATAILVDLRRSIL